MASSPPGSPERLPAEVESLAWLLGTWRGEGHGGYPSIDDFEYVESPTHADKVRFMQSIDVLAVSTTYREPKGLYVLEAWANGVPVVLPRHGSFPELVEMANGGLLVDPDDPRALAAGLRQMLEDHDLRDRCGRAGEAVVRDRFTAPAMAGETVAVLERHTRPATLPS